MLRLIKTECLLEGAEVGENIYGVNGNLLVSQGTQLTENQIAHLLNMGVLEVPVAANRLKDLVEPALVRLPAKNRAFAALTTLFNSLQNGNPEANLAELQEAAQEIVLDIQELQPRFLNFPYPQGSGHYLVIHALYTGILAAGLGFLAGFKEHLLDITLGSLLSDTGLMLLSKSILDKPGPLDEAEQAMVKQHPGAAVHLLGSTSAYVKAIVYQHHERADGSGYPKSLGSKEIHPYASLVGLADIYVAMLANRPYRAALLPHSILEMIMSMSGWEFDHALIQHFTRVIPPYPVGTFVHLSTGEKGAVVALTDAFCRPTVRILNDTTGAEVEPHDVVLAERENQTILIDEILLD